MSPLLCIGGSILRVRGHLFEYYPISLVDLFSEGLVEKVSLFDGSSKTCAVEMEVL